LVAEYTDSPATPSRPGDGRDEHQVPGASLAHLWQQRPGQGDGCGQIDHHEPVHVSGRHAGQRACPADPGVVDHDVHPAGRGERSLREPAAGIRAGQVRDERHRADLLGQFGEPGGVAPVREHPRAGRGEPDRTGPPDTRRRPGHQRDLAPHPHGANDPTGVLVAHRRCGAGRSAIPRTPCRRLPVGSGRENRHCPYGEQRHPAYRRRQGDQPGARVGQEVQVGQVLHDGNVGAE
jgi:hypothetical protein